MAIKFNHVLIQTSQEDDPQQIAGWSWWSAYDNMVSTSADVRVSLEIDTV